MARVAISSGPRRWPGVRTVGSDPSRQQMARSVKPRAAQGATGLVTTGANR